MDYYSAEFYLGATLALVAVCYYSNRQSFDVSVLLLVQYTLANLFYEAGTVEATSTIWSMVGISFAAFVLYRIHRDWLPIAVILCCLTIAVWSAVAAVNEYSPYTFKAVKNAVYAVEIVLCLAAFLSPSSGRASSR